MSVQEIRLARKKLQGQFPELSGEYLEELPRELPDFATFVVFAPFYILLFPFIFLERISKLAVPPTPPKPTMKILSVVRDERGRIVEVESVYSYD